MWSPDSRPGALGWGLTTIGVLPVKTIAKLRCCVSSLSPSHAARVFACLGAGALAGSAGLGVMSLSGCSKPQEGSYYHSDIDHDVRPLDVFTHSHADHGKDDNVDRNQGTTR